MAFYVMEKLLKDLMDLNKHLQEVHSLFLDRREDFEVCLIFFIDYINLLLRNNALFLLYAFYALLLILNLLPFIFLFNIFIFNYLYIY